MQEAKKRSIDSWFDLGVLAFIALFVSWYLYDAYKALDSVDNLILILPISVLVLILCVFELKFWFTNKAIHIEDEKVQNIIPAIILFGAYVLSLEYLGFDVGTSLFVFCFLRAYGEKKWLINIIYSVLFGLVVAFFFSQMLPYPMPMLILPTDY